MHKKIITMTVGRYFVVAVFSLSTILFPVTAFFTATALAASSSGTWQSIPSEQCKKSGETHKVTADLVYTNASGKSTTFHCFSITDTPQSHSMLLISDNSDSCGQPQIVQVSAKTFPDYRTDTVATWLGDCGKTADNNFHLTDTFDSVGTTDSGSSSSGGSSSSTACADPCPIPCGTNGRWLYCMFSDLFLGALTALSNIIGSLLDTPVNLIFTSDFEGAFNVFRNIGIGLLVIAGLVMVIAQASGTEIFAAHTVRKALPRIVIAAIGIALAWPLLKFTIILFNDLGYLVGRIILQVTNQHTAGIVLGNAGNPVAFQVDLFVASALATAGLAALILSLTVGGFLSLILSALLMLLVGLLVLALRQVVILLCIILAPIAIACYVLPSTERVWKFWKDTLLTTLIMYPIIMGFLAAGEAMAFITLGVRSANPLFGILAILEFFAPYAFLPFAFKLAGGLMSQVVSLAQGFHGQSIEGRLRQYRQGERQWLHQQRMEGRTGWSTGAMGNLYRRFGTRGGVNADWLTRGRIGAGGEFRYQEQQRKHMGQLAAKTAQEDAGYMSGDDDATELASYVGQTREGFLTEYTRRYQAKTGANAAVARGYAEQALAGMQSSFNADIGSQQLAMAAWKARANSPTGYEGTEQGLSQLTRDAQRMIRSGLMTESDVIQTIKANKARADQSSISWGTWQTALRGDLGVAANAPRDATIDASILDGMRTSAITGAAPYSLIGARPETINALSGAMTRRVQDAAGRLADARTQGIDTTAAERALMQALANTAGLHDAMAQISPENAIAMANGVMGQEIDLHDGRRLTINQLVDENRGDEEFRQMRREYMNAAAAQQGQQAQQGQSGAPGAPQNPTN